MPLNLVMFQHSMNKAYTIYSILCCIIDRVFARKLNIKLFNQVHLRARLNKSEASMTMDMRHDNVSKEV